MQVEGSHKTPRQSESKTVILFNYEIALVLSVIPISPLGEGWMNAQPKLYTELILSPVKPLWRRWGASSGLSMSAGRVLLLVSLGAW